MPLNRHFQKDRTRNRFASAKLLRLCLLYCGIALITPPAIAQLDTPDPADMESNFDHTRAVGETPTMARNKIKRAVALRDEAAQLKIADGGTLTPAHALYLCRKAASILKIRCNLEP